MIRATCVLSLKAGDNFLSFVSTSVNVIYPLYNMHLRQTSFTSTTFSEFLLIHISLFCSGYFPLHTIVFTLRVDYSHTSLYTSYPQIAMYKTYAYVASV